MRFSSTIVSAALLTLANAASLSGQATFYGGNVAGGACSFSTYTLPSDIFGTALSDSNWNNSVNCGACVSVTGPSGNSILAMIVDECPGCGLNHLDLFPNAFADLADPTTGVIDVTWDFVDCPITSPLQLNNKDGVSEFWFSMQVVNANQAVSTLEVSTDGGSTWQSTIRQTYNFFEISSGTGTTTADIKVTSVDGDVVIVNNVGISSGTSTTASNNFGSSGAVASAASTPVASSPSESASPVAASSTPAAAEVVTPTSEAPAAAAPVGTTTADGVDFQELGSSVASLPTTPVATILAGTSAPVAVVSKPSTSTITSPVSTSAAGGVFTSSPSLSVMTISTCIPTVITSVFTVSPTTKATPSSTSSRNGTVLSATASPTQFTGSASSVQGSIAFAAVAGLVGLIFA